MDNETKTKLSNDEKMRIRDFLRKKPAVSENLKQFLSNLTYVKKVDNDENKSENK